MRNAPCFHCPKRSALCHAHCEDYPAWAEDVKAEHEALRRARDADAHTQKTIEKNCIRAQTKRRVGQL